VWYDATSGPQPGLFSGQHVLCRHANTGPRGTGGLVVAALLGLSRVARPPVQLPAVQDDDLAAAHLNQLAGG
jgi:hypothetical protein